MTDSHQDADRETTGEGVDSAPSPEGVEQDVTADREAQLEQLSGYAAETQQRWGMREGAAVQPEVMRHHYQFMGRLDHAIGLQTQAVSGQDQRVHQAGQVLLQAELRLASLRKVLERRRADLLREQQRREQKQTDELASQRAAARAGAVHQE